MYQNYKHAYIFLILLISLSVACKQQADDSNVQLIKINNNSILQSSDISALIDSLSIIELQESPGNYVAEAYKIFTIKDKIIVFDLVNTHKINLYDSQGAFIKNIVKTGENKNDAFQINDCWIDGKNNLRLLDYAAKKIMIFDKDFKLSKVIKAKQLSIFSNVASLPNSEEYVGFASFSNINQLQNNRTYQLAFLDSSFDIQNTQLSYNKTFQGINWLAFSDQFHTYNDTLRFGRFLDNYIYNIYHTDFYKRFKLVYDNKPLPDDILETTVKAHTDEFKNVNGIAKPYKKYLRGFNSFYGTWLENKEMIYFNTLGSNDSVYYGIVDKTNHFKVTNLSYKYSVNKKFAMDLPPFQHYDNRGFFIGSMNGKWLKKMIKPNSPLFDIVKDDVTKIYLIKAKLVKKL